MELTVTNRSQAYPNAEKEISKQSVGLKKSKKDLQKLIGCSIMLYVVLKVHKVPDLHKKTGTKEFKKYIRRVEALEKSSAFLYRIIY